MNLYEHEGKKILVDSGVRTPRAVLFHEGESIPSQINFPVFVKAQILSASRKEAGGILVANDAEGLARAVDTLLGSTIKGWRVDTVLVEEKISFRGSEYYLSFACDTENRAILFLFAESGGTGIEDRPVTKIILNRDNPQFPNIAVPKNLLQKLFDIFCTNDCLLLEINPLVVEHASGEWVALDVKIILDDLALARHQEFIFPPRAFAVGKAPTEREIAAKAIDTLDHRGSAGSSYLDLDGDIAMLPSGGGASLLAMDALLRKGGRPANYTEYSGNPTGEKVKKLVAIVVSKPNLAALWVVGAIANFTDIYETQRGLIDGLRAARIELGLAIDYPIIIRRGGPRDEEAYAMLREVKDFDIHVSGEETSIEMSAAELIKHAYAYKHR